MEKWKRLRARAAQIVPCLAAASVILACGSEDPSHHAASGQIAWSLEDLEANGGLSLRLPEREVPRDHEEQSCYFVRVPDLADGKDFWIDRVRVGMNEGSHHLNVFRVKTIKGLRPEDGEPTKIGPYDATVVHGGDEFTKSPCWDSSFWSDWPLVANTQHGEVGQPYTEWKLPESVAMRFSPGELLMVQTHYVNTSTQPTPSGKARVSINFYRTTNPNPMELGTLFATQQSIRICKSNPNPTFAGTCRIPGNVTVTAANGHFHSRGKTFNMYTWDGKSVSHPPESQQFYTSSSWDHPDMKIDIGAKPPVGGGIWWDCEYKWKKPLFGCETVDSKDPEKQGDCCYTFGGNTDVGEHCNVFLYYYPKVADQDIFCN